MQARYTIGIAVLLIAVGGFFLVNQRAEAPGITEDAASVSLSANQTSPMADLTLMSSAFEPNGAIPPKYTCDGDNTSPPLEISGVPEGAQSLVLIMDDPDAVKPAGKVWDHWVVFNIPPSVAVIAEGREPEGVQGMTSFGSTGYGGPCPPDREHRYVFKLYALDTMLDLPEGATKAEVERAMEGHVLDQTELAGRYERQ